MRGSIHTAWIAIVVGTILVTAGAMVTTTYAMNPGTHAGSAGNNPVDIMDLAPDIQGYNEVIYQGTYDEYINYLESLDIDNANSYFTDTICTPERIPMCFHPKNPGTPQHFLLVEYADTEGRRAVWVEIYDFGNKDLASKVYSDQTSFYGNKGGMFKRFRGQMVLLHRERFLVFFNEPSGDMAGKSILTGVTQAFVDNLFKVIPNEQPSPPSVSSKVIWGVKPGDIISWEWTCDYPTGTAESKKTIEIVQTTDDNSAILIRRSENSPPDFNYAVSNVFYSGPEIGGNIQLTIPAYSYSWETGMVWASAPCVLLYPIHSQGKTLEEVMKSQDYTVTEDADNIMGSYRYRDVPPSGYGLVSREGLTRYITVHKGSGITTSASSSSYNKEYQTSESCDLKLTGTNFDLSSRVPVPITESPTVSTTRPSVVPTTRSSAVSTTRPTAVTTTESPAVSTTEIEPVPAPSIMFILTAIGAAAYLRSKKK